MTTLPPAPKSLVANMASRDRILRQCAVDEEFRELVWMACARDISFYVDLFCLAEGTPVVTDRGLVPIESVLPSDKVWDGLNWVSQGGAIFRGCKSVIFEYGIHLTPDHKVWTINGWKNASDGYDRQAVRLPDGYLKEWNLHRNNTRRVALPMRLRGRDNHVGIESAYWQGNELRLREESNPYSDQARQGQVTNLRGVEINAGEMRESKEPRLRSVRWAGHQSLQAMAPVRELLFGHGGCANRNDIRSNRQQRKLCADECSLGVPWRAGEQPTIKHNHSHIKGRNDLGTSGERVRCDTERNTKEDAEWIEGGSTPCAITKAKASVYDLVNCGPRQAFTVIGEDGRPLLVHNCYTYNPKSFPDNPIRPFILWPYQETALLKICDAIGKHDIPVKKSRDAGASWLCLLAFEWRWHFRKGQSFLLVSRVEDLVDKKNEPDCLFWKLDFLHENQPGWLVPKKDRNSKTLYNLDNGSSITGSSTTGEAGRGGRKTAILLDEFAAVPDGYAMLSATRDATDTRVMNSTPKGSAGAYADQLTKVEKNNPDHVITMHWADHPLKLPGLYRVTTKENADPVIDIIDKEWHAAHPNYAFVTSGPFFWNGELRSPWYDEQCNRAASPQEIAQELDMKMAESAYQYFDSSVLARLREKHACAPYHRGEIRWDGEDWKTARWDETPNGRVLLWFNPDPAGRIPWTDLVIGCDVATGKGGDMSSNSVASIVRASTGEKIGEFTVNTLSPFEFCEYVLAMCNWCNGAFLIYEDTGPGGEFTRRLRDGSAYGNVYRRDADEKSLSRKKTKKLGFAPTPGTKRALLAEYKDALMLERFINHSDEALAECGQYEVLPTQDIQHSKALASIDPNARGKNHGDRVIADALAWRAIKDRGQSSAPAVSTSSVPPNCALARFQARESRAQAASSW